MTAFLALIASVAALALALFVYRTSNTALLRKDAASLFVGFPIIFAASALWKANPWLAGLALLIVSVGWIYVLRAGRPTIGAAPHSTTS